MAKKRHTAEQIIAKLREAEILLAKDAKMPQVCRKLEVTEQTYYRWRKEYGGVRTGQAQVRGSRALSACDDVVLHVPGMLLILQR